MSQNSGILDRMRGAFYGMAVGDALGAAIEFQPPGSFNPVVGYRGGGPHGIPGGAWTDDTSMALALADSIASVGWDLNDQAKRYLAWWQNGQYSVNGRCFDIGTTTRAALARFQTSGDAKSTGDPSPRASGNGSIMRLAPVPIRFAHFFPANLKALSQRAAESSLPTHASPSCLSACRYMTLAMAGLFHGLDRDIVLDAQWGPLEELQRIEPLDADVARVAAGSFRKRQPPAIRGSGYVIDCLEAALWAFHQAEDFSTAVLNAVNLGHDADTTGAVCGQWAGAYWGFSGIPRPWLDDLVRRDLIDHAIDRLLACLP